MDNIIEDYIDNLKMEISDLIDASLEDNEPLLVTDATQLTMNDLFKTYCENINDRLNTMFQEQFPEFIEKNKDDTVMLNEDFNNWTDALSSNKELPTKICNRIDGRTD